MPKILSKREKIILYVAIGVIVFSLGFNFLIAPGLGRNDVLNREISMVRTKLKKYRWLLSQKDYIQNKYNKFSSTLKLPGEQADTLTGALAELENLAKDANVRIIDLRPQPTINPSEYQEIIIDLRAEGTMEGYLKFIYNLENSLSLLKIKRFQLSAKPNNPALEGNFSISRISGL
ncbi:MAG: hypothetical protein FJZ13_03895 [Candidatus Omnitrophica bacterium]|nr:hypothetical protein [Candidatus Omnitrophota bacterium]